MKFRKNLRKFDGKYGKIFIKDIKFWKIVDEIAVNI